MNRAAKIGAAIAALLLILALYRANDAADSAKRTADQRDRDAQAALVRNYRSAIASCASSRQLRALWDRVDELLIPDPTAVDEDVRLTHEAIKAYTATNPNCQHLPPKPKGA